MDDDDDDIDVEEDVSLLCDDALLLALKRVLVWVPQVRLCPAGVCVLVSHRCSGSTREESRLNQIKLMRVSVYV